MPGRLELEFAPFVDAITRVRSGDAVFSPRLTIS